MAKHNQISIAFDPTKNLQNLFLMLTLDLLITKYMFSCCQVSCQLYVCICLAVRSNVFFLTWFALINLIARGLGPEVKQSMS